MWWYRLAAGVACATVALFTLAGSAQAGGWAVTTIDALPEGGFQAGQMYRLGYMIRQHGQHPFPGAQTSIQITSAATGETLKFPGRPDGPPGHYVAEVIFPSEGAWSWEVSQYPFAVQSLGTVTVVPPMVADAGTGAKQPFAAVASDGASVPVALPLALLFLLALLVRPLAGLMRRQRGEAPAAREPQTAVSRR